MCQYTEGCMCEDGDVPMCEPAFTEWVNYVPDVSSVRTLTERGVPIKARYNGWGNGTVPGKA